MLLPPVNNFFEDLIGINFFPFLEKITGVSQRTFKNAKKNIHKPRPATINKIFNKIDSNVRENNPNSTINFYKNWEKLEHSPFGWNAFLSCLNAGSHPYKFYPKTQHLIENLELYSKRLVIIAKESDYKKATQYLLSTSLPESMFDVQLIKKLESSENIDSFVQNIMVISLKVIIYLIASIDAEIPVGEGCNPSKSSKFACLLPAIERGKLILPIAHLMRKIQEKVGCSSISKLVKKIDAKTGDKNVEAPSVERQMYRWLNGEKIPTWRKLDEITDYLFPDYDLFDRRISVAPAIIFQKIFRGYEEMKFRFGYPETYDEIFEIFAQYEGWFDAFSIKYNLK